MAYGFSAINYSGYTQIDGSTKNFKVVASGYSTSAIVSFPTQSVIPLVFVRSSVYSRKINCDSVTTSSFNCVVEFNTPFYYKVVIPVTSNSSSVYGMRIWNESASLVYDTGDDAIMIDYFNQSTPPQIEGSAPVTFTLSTPNFGYRYICLNLLRLYNVFYIQTGEFEITYYYYSIYGIINSETSVTLGDFSTYNATFGSYGLEFTGDSTRILLSGYGSL